jgi:hypothetical protein
MWTIEKAQQAGLVKSPKYEGGGQFFSSRTSSTAQQKDPAGEPTSFSGLYVPR